VIHKLWICTAKVIACLPWCDQWWIGFLWECVSAQSVMVSIPMLCSLHQFSSKIKFILSHESSVREKMYITVCSLHSPGSISDGGDVFKGIFLWPTQHGRKWLNLPSMADQGGSLHPIMGGQWLKKRQETLGGWSDWIPCSRENDSLLSSRPTLSYVSVHSPTSTRMQSFNPIAIF